MDMKIKTKKNCDITIHMTQDELNDIAYSYDDDTQVEHIEEMSDYVHTLYKALMKKVIEAAE